MNDNQQSTPLIKQASYDKAYDPIYSVAYGVSFIFYQEEELCKINDNFTQPIANQFSESLFECWH